MVYKSFIRASSINNSYRFYGKYSKEGYIIPFNYNGPARFIKILKLIDYTIQYPSRGFYNRSALTNQIKGLYYGL